MPKANSHLNFSVTFRHTDSTPALKKYATDKLTHCLSKYVPGEADVRLVLSVEKRDHIVEAKVLSKGYDIAGKAVTTDLYSAIDKVVDNIDTQFRKQKERQVKHK